mmetsp:Transcript_123611/g.395430  ORF Transcript_123611/g.395430 Transcript_123611/m.395430 type:complete len:519 (-) Transcript_123611:132-1688(-)
MPAREQRASNASSLRVGPKVDAAVPKDKIKDMYFTTTTERVFTGRQLPTAGRMENLREVHCIGQKSTKYLKYQHRKAPLLDRSACQYTQDYKALPLGDAAVNTQLACSFKEAAQNSMLTSPEGAKLVGETKYADDFKPPSEAQTRGARQRSCKPKAKRANTLSTGGKLLESQSASHEQFGTPDLSMAKNEPVVPPKGNLAIAFLDKFAPPKTAYQQEFGHRAASVPLLERSSQKPGALRKRSRNRPKKPQLPQQAPQQQAPQQQPFQACQHLKLHQQPPSEWASSVGAPSVFSSKQPMPFQACQHLPFQQRVPSEAASSVGACSASAPWQPQQPQFQACQHLQLQLLQQQQQQRAAADAASSAGSSSPSRPSRCSSAPAGGRRPPAAVAAAVSSLSVSVSAVTVPTPVPAASALEPQQPRRPASAVLSSAARRPAFVAASPARPRSAAAAPNSKGSASSTVSASTASSQARPRSAAAASSSSRWSASSPSTASSAPTASTVESEIWKVRRAPYLSPGM